MALPEVSINTSMVRDEVGASTNVVSELVQHVNVNRWGINPPDETQFAKYYGVPNYNLQAPFELGMFRRYEHRYRAYSYDKVEKTTNYTSGYVGLKVFTKIINELISDDAIVSDTILRLTFEYISPTTGNYVSGGFVTGSVNKVGDVLLHKHYTDLNSILANKIRMTLSSDTPLTARYFDARKVPITVGEGLIRDDLYFEYINNNTWLLDYNLFPNYFNHYAPDGTVQDVQGFWNLQTSNYAYWGANGVGIYLTDIKTINESPYSLTLVFRLRVSDTPSFNSYDEYAMTNAPFTINRAWYTGGATQYFGTGQNPIEFDQISWQNGVTKYCWLIAILSGSDEPYMNWEDTNLFNIKFTMI